MSKEKFLIIFFSVVLMLYLIVILIIEIINLNKKNEKVSKKLLKTNDEKVQREEERNKWNKKIQDKFDGDVNYKSNRKIKVLVGDYNQVSAVFTNSILKSMDIETIVVPTASDIIDMIENGNNYDIIITNNTYPRGESGDFVLNSLKNIEHFNIPIIILTVDKNERKLYKSKGFAEYIAKPISEKNVIKVFPQVIKGLKFTKIKSNNLK